jgi:3-oxoacyl-[acyl-carrier protein] reductase
MRKRFANRNVVITGAAGGLGRALAQGFGREGAHLILTDTQRDGLEETAAILADETVTSSVHVINLAVEANIKEFGVEVCETYEHIDVLLNNAGIAYGEIHQPIETLSQEKWLTFFSVNTLAPLLMGQALRPALAKANGVIINQTSSASFVPANAYGLTKQGLNAMTLGMAHAFAKDDIRVVAVAPGIMETPAGKANLSPETYNRVQSMQLLKRHGTAQNIVDLTLFLASDEATFINCEIVSCDAGNTMRGWRY